MINTKKPILKSNDSSSLKSAASVAFAKGKKLTIAEKKVINIDGLAKQISETSLKQGKHMTVAAVREFIGMFIPTIQNLIHEGISIKIPGLGKIETRKLAERSFISITQQKDSKGAATKISVPARLKVTFKAAKILNDFANHIQSPQSIKSVTSKAKKSPNISIPKIRSK